MGMIMVTTTDGFEGYRIVEYMGIVRGISIRVPRIGLRDIHDGIEDDYIELCDNSRNDAYNKLIDDAVKWGANAIVGFRTDSCKLSNSDNATEVVMYGTAVKIDKVMFD